MINILMIIPNRQDATSFYRSMGPFSHLHRSMELNLIFADQIDWSLIKMSDIVFMQRPFNSSHLQVAALCQEVGRPLWVDYDDLLFDIPEDNPAHESFMAPEVRNNVIQIIRAATVVTVSTEQLKKVFQLEKNTLNHRVYTVPNALDHDLIKYSAPFQFKKLLSWRGSNTHMQDIAEHAASLIDLIRARPDVTTQWVGWNPWFVTQGIAKNQAIVAPPMAIHRYYEFMQKTNPSVQVVPLHEHMFNYCKSNIAWIEATLVGAVCVGPDWAEWRKPGILTYKTTEDFKSCIEYALDNPEEMKKLHEESLAYIVDNLMIGRINKGRESIINALNALSRGSTPVWMDGGERIQDHVMELE